MSEVCLKEDGRTVSRDVRKTYDIQKLWDSNREILRLIALGWKDREIAEKLNITPQTVSNTRNSTLGKRQLAIIRGARDAETFSVMKKVDELLPKAFKVYEEILESEGISSLKKQTADTVVKDLAGHAAPTKVDVRQSSVIMERIEIVKERANLAREAIRSSKVMAEQPLLEGGSSEA